jgi:hypothetical protein
MPAGKDRRLTGQPEALERGAKFFAAAWKRRVRTDDLREPALHRKLTSHCIAATSSAVESKVFGTMRPKIRAPI